MDFIRPLLLLLTLLAPLHAHSQDLRIGVVLNDLDNPFFAKILEGVRQAADRHGIPASRVEAVDSRYDVDRQINQIHELKTRGANAFVLTAADAVALKPHLDWLVARGIPVIAVDVRAYGASTTFNTHNVNTGRIACRHLAQRLNRRGRIAVINGPRVTAVIERIAGCEYELQQNFPRIIVMNDDISGQGTEPGGYDAMRKLLADYPNLDAVFAINDPTAMGADRALADAGRTDVLIASVDGSPEIVERMAVSHSQIISTSTQNPRQMGFKAVDAAVKLLSGEDVPSYNLIETRLVTLENLESYTGW